KCALNGIPVSPCGGADNMRSCNPTDPFSCGLPETGTCRVWYNHSDDRHFVFADIAYECTDLKAAGPYRPFRPAGWLPGSARVGPCGIRCRARRVPVCHGNGEHLRYAIRPALSGRDPQEQGLPAGSGGAFKSLGDDTLV